MADEPNIWDREFDAQVEQDGDWIQEPEIIEEVSPQVVSLLNLGELHSLLQIRDHEIKLRTLRMNEELEIGILIQKYVGTIEEGRALATAIVAASIVTVDGKPIVSSVGPNDDGISRKFNYVRTKLYWPVIKAIYEEGYIPLLNKQIQALEDFRKK